MSTPGVGQDIEALCGKCGQVWHVVMAKMGDRIAKVVCKRCGGHHRYRTDGDDVNETARPARARTTTASRARTATPAPVLSAPAFDPAKPARPYAVAAQYTPGERILHPQFGVGVVAGSPGSGKIDVVFPTGARVLAVAKSVSSLARPIAVAVPVADRPPSAK